MKPVVRTVLGDVEPDRLGVVDMHDHLFINGGPATERDPDLLLDDPAAATQEVDTFKMLGGGTIVDAMPSGCGRDPEGLAAVSLATGVHIIATAGFHSRGYYDRLHWARRYEEPALADVIHRECEKGFARFDHWGPDDQRLPIRPGLLKCGVGFHAIRPEERRQVAAITYVHSVVGLPILIHLEHGTGGHHVLDTFDHDGVQPGRLALSHVDRNPDPHLHVELASRGCMLVYDGLYRERYHPLSSVTAAMAAVIDAGFEDRILIGADVARRSLRRAAGAPGISGLLSYLVPRLRSELGDSAVDRALVANPQQFLAIPTKGST